MKMMGCEDTGYEVERTLRKWSVKTQTMEQSDHGNKKVVEIQTMD